VPEGAERQAREAVDLYRRLFEHPAVTAITWWDVCDSHACLHIPCGVLRADGSPKTVYEALRRLIREEWRSAGTAATDAAGNARIEGFAGVYAVESERGGRRLPIGILGDTRPRHAHQQQRGQRRQQGLERAHHSSLSQVQTLTSILFILSISPVHSPDPMRRRSVPGARRS
jgi:hypothetical protein